MSPLNKKETLCMVAIAFVVALCSQAFADEEASTGTKRITFTKDEPVTIHEVLTVTSKGKATFKRGDSEGTVVAAGEVEQDRAKVAIAAYLEKDFTTARDAAIEWVNDRPKDPVAHFVLGCAFSQFGRQWKVLEHHNIARNELRGGKRIKAWTSDLVQQYPNNAPTAELNGCAYSLAGDLGKNLGEYERAIALDPSYHMPYFNLANVYQRQEQYSKAKDLYQSLVSRFPKNAWAYNGLGVLYNKQFNEPEKAQASFEKALAVDGSCVPALYNYGNLLLMRFQQYDKATEMYERALQEEPDAVALHVNIAGAYYFAGKKDKAHSHFRKAAALDPDGRYGAIAKRNLATLWP